MRRLSNRSARSKETPIRRRHTVVEYVSLLESTFAIRLLPPWGKILRSRVSKRPKIHLTDTGIAARLLHIKAEQLIALEPSALTEFGHLLETFVVNELIKQATWLDGITGWYHWHTYDHIEVDMILERDDGYIIGIEVKSGTRVSQDDMYPLKKLRDKVGNIFLCGVVLYLGERSYRYENDLYVFPVDRLWQA